MDRPTWDETGRQLAQVIANRAACTRSQVGAVVVSQDRTNVFLGYNGVPSGQQHCTDGGCPRGRLSYEELAACSSYDNCPAVHAEDNALQRAGSHAAGGVIYVTREPCPDCYQLIEKAGIAEVIW